MLIKTLPKNNNPNITNMTTPSPTAQETRTLGVYAATPCPTGYSTP